MRIVEKGTHQHLQDENKRRECLYTVEIQHWLVRVKTLEFFVCRESDRCTQ